MASSMVSPPCTVFCLFLFASLMHAYSPYSDDCCRALSGAFKDKVFYPSDVKYQASLDSYWSLQEVQVIPRCIFTPSGSQDIQSAVRILTADSSSDDRASEGHVCQFAIRGGGHTAHAGSANIEDGVTIDMGAIDEIDISQDRTSVSVGAGQVWGNVYETLQSVGLAAVGGRSSVVGVGGLTLGGGLSYFSTRRGFSCDNVISYEIVLANGSIVEATKTMYPDLWLALKGGSNNFGIVTRFVLRTFAQGDLWAGKIFNGLDTVTQQVEAFHDFSSRSPYDPDASMIQSFGFSGNQGSAIVNWLTYAEPVVDPPAFQPFTKIQPQLASTLAIVDLVSESRNASLDAPSGFWQKTFATSFRNSIETLRDTFDLWNSSTVQVSGVKDITFSISLQLVSSYMTDEAERAGGNSLGLSVSSREDTLILAFLSATWSDATDSPTVERASDKLLRDIRNAARKSDTLDPYIDLNHAGKDQDPIGGYGRAVNRRLRAVSKKYDPRGVFQRAVPGGFKL